jgi:uncharacterized membrane protein YeiB
VISGIQVVVFLALYLVVFLMCVVALVDAARRRPKAFLDAGKRTKRFWILVLVAALAVSFVAIPWPAGIGQLHFVALGSAVAAGVYLADVRPAVDRYSGGGPRGGW